MRNGSSQAFEPWPWSTDDHGKPRRVGVEIELGGLDVEATSRVVVEVLGGAVVPEGPHQLTVEGTRIGDIKVELDSRFIKEQRFQEVLKELGIDPDQETGEVLDALVSRAASAVVPCEIVTGPLLFEELESLEGLRAELHRKGAQGTGAAPWYAFGVHFNPSLPSLTVASIHAFLQAYCLLEDWIRNTGEIDFSRRITPYIDPFPESYRKVVLESLEPPSLRKLIESYLLDNPTRNRGLDMLPAFSHLDAKLVAQYVDDSLVKPRPTFHYRVSDCRVDEPDWRLAQEWSRWIAVERLAQNATRRADLIQRGVRAEGEAWTGP